MLVKSDILPENSSSQLSPSSTSPVSPYNGRDCAVDFSGPQQVATAINSNGIIPSNQYNQLSESNRHDSETSKPTPLIGTSADESNSSASSSPQNQSSRQGIGQDNECQIRCSNITNDTIGYGKNVDDDCVTIIHFNDCYNIEPGPQSSGAAGFLTAVNQHRHLNPIILFSGDILSPSFMSTFTKGEQMIPVLNDIGVHCAVFGNHEFDYGVDNLIDFVKRTTFPWLLSNVIDKETSNQLGDGKVYHVIERSGIKFGLIGLIEEEWLSTLSTLDSSDVIYQDFVTRGQELARWLKSEPHNVDYVIALTHFRTPNDIRLADSVPEIDLILGGHDHDYEVIKRPNCYIIKSGTDFREFSKIELKINTKYMEFKRRDNGKNCANNNNDSDAAIGHHHHQQQQQQQSEKGVDKEPEKPFLNLDIEHVKCVSYKPDMELKNKLDKFVTTIDEKMDKVLGQFNCELDGRFASIRRGETNLGNFVTDIMLASTHADLAILNSGTLRSDRIHPRGDFTMRDLFNILGYIDPIAVLDASGHQIWRALENGVSQWPKLEGRFPQISGCSFTFDPSKPSMKRIDPKDIMIGDDPLQLDKKYKLTTKAYLASGKDGYDILKECQILVPGDESPDLTTSILNHFEAINIVKSNRRTHHRQSIICMSRTSLVKMLGDQASGQVNCCISHSEEAAAAAAAVAAAAAAGEATTAAVAAGASTNVVVCESTTTSTQLMLLSNNSSSNSTAAILPEVEEEIVQDDNNNNNNNNNSIFGEDILATTPSIVTAVNNADNCATNQLVSNGGGGGGRHHLQFLASSPIEGVIAPPPLFRANSNESELISCVVPTATATSNNTIVTNPASSPGTPFAMQRQPRAKRLMSLYEIEHEQCKLEPKIEGRIRILGVDA